MSGSREQFYSLYVLPDQSSEFLPDWDAVVISPEIKDRLISYADTLRRLTSVPAVALGLRRALLLFGPPGCGKTSLARSLAARWCAVSGAARAGFIHVNTHALFSGVRGEGQKNILETFRRIEEQASAGVQTFVLIDEIETLGTDRASISLETNPLDALYQVTALLESLDRCARVCPNVIFIFTTNLPKAVDRAVRERVDFALEIPLPGPEHRSTILADAVRAMSVAFDVNDLLRLAESGVADPTWAGLVESSEGFSGRSLRHVLVLAATLAGADPTLRADHLLRAIDEIGRVEESLASSGGMYVESYQRSQKEYACK